MLRIHRVQQKSSRIDPSMAEALIEVPAIRRWGGIKLIHGRNPDESTTLTIRQLLETHDLGEPVLCFAEDYVDGTLKAHLCARGMTLRQGTRVDAPLIEVTLFLGPGLMRVVSRGHAAAPC